MTDETQGAAAETQGAAAQTKVQIAFALEPMQTIKARSGEGEINISQIPAEVWEEFALRGLGACIQPYVGKVFGDKEKADTDAGKAKLQDAINTALAVFLTGEVSDGPGRGRQSDPLKTQMRALAEAEVTAATEKLMAFHGVNKGEFDKEWRTKYINKRLTEEPHKTRLETQAKEILAKMSEGGEVKAKESSEFADF